jgi:3-oxoacyl-[acyl-carrier protein] reductase
MLKNKNVIILGARTGIGLETLKTFAKNEATIYACVRNSDKNFDLICKELEKRYDTKIFITMFDVNNIIKTKEKLSELLSKIPKIDIFINTTALIEFCLFEMSTLSFAKKVFETNFFSQIQILQMIIKKMKKAKSGSIINLSSSAVLENNIGTSVYASSKVALETLSKVISKEVGKFNVRVNIVQPGLVDTEAMRKVHPEKFIDDQVEKYSLKKIASSKDVANLILFLASDDSSHITGQVIKINGGI